MSIFTHVNPSNIRVKPFEINEIVSIEKKKKFCDRPNVTFVEKDSGKKISVELQTIVYEYIKTTALISSQALVEQTPLETRLREKI